jgi:WD40 repeat protein
MAKAPTPLMALLGADGDLSEHVVALHWLGDICLAAGGEGAVVGFRPDAEEAWRLRRASVLSAAANAEALFVGGDDGRVLAVDAGGGERVALDLKGKWVQALDVAATGQAAAAIGKEAVIIKPEGGESARFAHDATVESLAFEPNGRRLACAHYNAVTISWASNPDSRRKRLEWKGAHLLVRWSPDAKFIVTAMQENALHGWRLQSEQHFRMAGYPTKIRAMDFSADGKWLVTSGAPEVVTWPFQSASGPMGQPAHIPGDMPATTARVACHPKSPVVAAGAETGEVALFRLDQAGPPILARTADGAAITALAWSPDGRRLAIGGENGFVGLLDFAKAA